MTPRTRPVSWIKAALNEFEKFPVAAQSMCLAALTIAAEGGKADVAEEVDTSGKDTETRDRSHQRSAEEGEGDVAMKGEKLDVVRGSGNVFRDLGRKNPDVEQLKAILAAEIIKALDHEALSVRGAQVRTGIAAADFSRIRNADLGRFTVDRLMMIINRLGSRIEVKIKVRRSEPVEYSLPA